MKRNIKSVILTVLMVFTIVFTGCDLLTNGTEKEKKNKTNTSANNPVNDDATVEPDITKAPDEIPLTLQAITSGTIIVSGKDSFERISIQKGNGLIFDCADNIDVQPGDIIHFYGINYKYVSDDPADIYYSGKVNLTIDCTADCYVYGNAMSLLYYTNFTGKTEIKVNYALQKLFLNNTHIKNHETLDIILPATTLSEGCYKKMFYGCTGLTRAPELPAATLTKECYNSMFLGCKNLNSIKCLATNILAADCTQNWVANVNKTGTFLCAQENSFWFYKDIASGIPRGWISDPPVASVDAKELPLTLEAIEDGVIVIINFNTFDNLQYSKNKGTKTNVIGNIPVSAGDKVCLFAEGPKDEDTDSLRINCSADCYIYGNIMSLIDPVNYKNLTTINKKNCFYNLFNPINNSNDTHLKNCAMDLVLPATTLTEGCYSGMFTYCSGLTVTPELPAETLADSCYESMFEKCNGLTVVPELPATTLAPACYEKMFLNCENLIIAPVLPAMSLQERCYSTMFAMCKNLIVAPELPATTLAKECYNSMFYFCEKLTIPPELGAENLAESCYFNMFANCTALICAPAILPAKELAQSCYASMFVCCTALTFAPELPATTLAVNCYDHMFSGCTELKDAPVLRAETLAENCYNAMFNGCTNIHIIQCLATNNASTSQGLSSGLNTNTGLLLCTNTGYFSDFSSRWIKVIEIPLSLEAIQSGNIIITNADSFNDFEYLKNYATLQSVVSTDPYSISVLAGDIIYFFAKGHKSNSTKNLQIGYDKDNACDCYVYGDLMSLDMSQNNYSNTISFSNTSTNNELGEFEKLFYNNVHIKNHPSKKLILSATTLKENCYKSMFEGCTELTEAPELPATTLAKNCYKSMFEGCTGLTEAPELPATTLAENCYEAMFKQCTGLTSAPELRAETLKKSCYANMFNECTGLTSAPDLTKATSLAENCYESMFYNCTGLTIAPELRVKNLAENCYKGMFSTCKGLISAPELPATTLKDGCYQSMFAYCTSLKIAPELPASTLVQDCYKFMFKDCSSLQYIKCLATNGYTDDNKYTENWVQNVPVGGTFVRAQTSNWDKNTVSIHAIPIGWTVESVTVTP